MKTCTLLLVVAFAISSCVSKQDHKGEFDMSIVIVPEQGFSPERASEILKQRLLKYGLDKNQFHIINENQIMIELMGVDDTQRLKNLVTPEGELEIRETYSNGDFYPYLAAVNGALDRKLMMVERKTGTNPLTGEHVSPSSIDSSIAMMHMSDSSKKNILFKKLSPAIYMTENEKFQLQPGPIIGYCMKDDTSEVMRMLNSHPAQRYLPIHSKFRWSLQPDYFHGTAYSLFAVNYDSAGTPFLSGNSVKHAHMDVNANGKPEISIELTDEAALKFRLMTKRNIDKFLAILFDSKVAIAPKVIAEVDGKRASITGADEEELKVMCDVLQSEPFPHSTKIKVHKLK